MVIKYFITEYGGTKAQQTLTHLRKTPLLPLSQAQLHSHTHLHSKLLCSPHPLSLQIITVHSVRQWSTQGWWMWSGLVVSLCRSFLVSFCFIAGPPPAAVPSGSACSGVGSFRKYVLWCGLTHRPEPPQRCTCSRSGLPQVTVPSWLGVGVGLLCQAVLSPPVTLLFLLLFLTLFIPASSLCPLVSALS